MTYGISHVCLPVRDLQRARALYSEALGFAVLAETEHAIDLDANGVTLRLEPAAAVPAAGRLRVQTNKVEKAVAELKAAGFHLLRAPAADESLEWTAELADPDGHRLLIWRRLREDELDAAPELPTTRSWSREASDLLQSLLARVPVLFRGIARRSATAEAEHLTAAGRAVGIEEVVRAYVRSTPRLMRERCREPLIEHGFDPEEYATDFIV